MSPTHGLLGLLLRGAAHGYELKRTIDQEFAPFWQIDFAQLYRSLAKMTRAGWVRVHIASGGQGPVRKVYALTPRGRAEFSHWLAQPAADHNEFLVKLGFSTSLGHPADALITAEQARLEDERAAQNDSPNPAASDLTLQRLLAHSARRLTDAEFASLDAARDLFRPALRISGSDDPLLTQLAASALANRRVVGSIGGLLALARHEADIAGAHLLDVETGEYNLPFVKHLLPEEDVLLVNLTVRENGLMVALGNPKNIRGVRDLTRRGVRLMNRPRGTGTRLLLYSKLRASHVDPRTLRDWERTADTHDAVAAAIIGGAADVGPGLRATAAAWGLDFIPLGDERYDLIIPRAVYESRRAEPLLDRLHAASLRAASAAFVGYDFTRTGKIVARSS